MIEEIASIVASGLKIWASFTNRPEGWRPTQADIDDLLAQVDASTPAAEKALARERLGLPPVD